MSLNGFRIGLYEYDDKQVFIADKAKTPIVKKYINNGSRIETLIKKHEKFKSNHNEITKDKTIRCEIALITSQFDIQYLNEKAFLYYKDNEKRFHYINNRLIVCYIIRKFVHNNISNEILCFAKLSIGNLLRLHQMELVDVL